MRKNTFIALALVMLAALVVNAGTWKIHPFFNSKKVENVFDTGDKVYYMNGGFLFQYDKATSAIQPMNSQNALSDSHISRVFFDWESCMLFVTYTNSNIDVIDRAGKVTNISNFVDMVAPVHNYALDDQYMLSSYVSKVINDITFAHGKAYVALGYGYAVIDEATMLVEKNNVLKQTVTVNSVAMMGDTLLLFTDNRCYYGTPGDPDPIANYKSATGVFNGVRVVPIDGQSVFLYGLSSGFYKYSFATGTPKLARISTDDVLDVQKSPTGFIVNYLKKGYSIFDATGSNGTTASTTLYNASAYPGGDGVLWIADSRGLHAQGTTVYHKPNGLMTESPHWLKYNATLDRLYAGESGPIISIYTSTSVPNVINTYDGTSWSNATAYTASGAGYEFVFSPIDPHTYVRSSWTSGIFKVKDDVKITNYTVSTAAFRRGKPTPAFDNYGNLWVVSSYKKDEDAADNACVVLPKAKFAKTNAVKSDWFIPRTLPDMTTGSMQRSRFIVAKKNNLKIYSDCDYRTGYFKGHLICWDNGQEDPTIDNYRYTSIGRFVDQNNREIDWTYLCHLEEDKDGMIWVGHTMGLFMFDPEGVFVDMPRAVRPHDGTGYLCEGHSVFDIGVDRDNNKWLATSDGVFFVSPDASVVYKHFTAENSDLPSNTVYSVECDTVNDRVYIYTDNGFAEYAPSGGTAVLNLDEVYAFPNPVKPDFTGLIQIGGLMDDCYVTIADGDGNPVAQFGPVVGSVLWDGTGPDGDRVPTGVYDVYVAQGAQPVIDGKPRTTVLVIK